LSRLITLVAFVGLLLALPSVAEAQKRVALIIGNGNYTGVSPLANPPNDARLMATTLRNLGFEVIEKIDASQKSMKRAVRDFGKLLKAGGDDSVGLFYYAGHGVQVKGTNYIIPVDAQIEQEGDVDIETINANAVLSMMEHSGAGLNFVILDACRNNPFLSSNRSGGRGLAEMNAPTGSYIAYATSPGDVAADGNGANSPYTTALTKAMLEPGIAVEQMFRKVRNDVRGATNNDQTPWESSSLIGGDFFFNPDSSVADQAATTTTSTELASLTPEKEFWNEIKGSTNPAMYEAYISQYPSGNFVAIAKVKIASLTTTAEPDSDTFTQQAALSGDMVIWQSIQGSDNPAEFEIFIQQYPNSPLSPYARLKLDKLKEAQVATITPAVQPAANDISGPISRLRGSNVLYLGYHQKQSERHCSLLREAGLNVECHPTWYDNDIYNDTDLVLRQVTLACPTLPDGTGQIIQEYLGISGYDIKDWRNDPDWDKCNEHNSIHIDTLNP
jgi:hypothetical protein